jgi:ABC-type multidrug transport system ATPase subunit
VLEEKRRGKTVLLTTQYLEEASRLCDHVVILDYGSVLVQGTPRELVARRGAHRLEFDAGDLPTPFLDAVRELAAVWEAAVRARVLTVTAGEGADAMRLIEELQSLATRHAVRLSLRRVEEPSLESVFLDLTGRTIRDTESA